jgi:hypothetical protein
MKAEFKFWRWAAVIGVLILGIVGSIAFAAPSGGGGGNGSADDNAPGKPRFDFRIERRGPGGGAKLSALAGELGVSTSKLREALNDAFEDVGPPDPPSNGDPPTRADFEKHCTELTDALGDKLGKSGDEVRDAIKSVLKKRIEAAVDANRLTRAQADRMITRIDAAECLPPGFHGLVGPGGRGCHGGRGHSPGRGDGREPGSFQRPAAPPGEIAVPL